ncbi:MAG: hypothetical protein J1E81_05830 [Eubacterium sp.]|nr:hypothetical protein [Eubacterium sp.]
MKKLIVMVLSLVMVLTTMAVYTVPAMAKDAVISPTATTATEKKKPSLHVNGSNADGDITFTEDPNNPNRVTFEYTGDGTVKDWEDNLADELGFIEGTDYTAVINDDMTYTITFISEDAIAAWNNGLVWVNAIVEYDDDTTSTTGKKDHSNKSPSTGAPTSAIAATVAVAGAGFAVLAATKKRDAE